MTTQTVGRNVAVAGLAVALLAGILAFLPAPVQVLAALICLPLGAMAFAGLSDPARRRAR